MARLIDADKLKTYFAPTLTGRTEYSADEILLTIATMPTVDAEPVIRCKDCWVFHQDESWNPKAGLCGWFDMPVGVNDFCSQGEKREDGYFIDRQATMNVVGLTTDAIKINPIETKYVDAQGNELVAVVRCKDCKFADETAMCGYVEWYNKPDDFCSRGERREDGNNDRN